MYNKSVTGMIIFSADVIRDTDNLNGNEDWL